MTYALNPAATAMLFALGLAFTVPASASDALNGEKLAKRWCAECHAVSQGQPRAQADAPSFASISANRKIPEIAAFLGRSHPQMPDMSLARDEIADLIAFMHTLAPPIERAPIPPAKDDYKPPARG